MNKEQRLTFVIMKANTKIDLMYYALNEGYKYAYIHWVKNSSLTLQILRNMLLMRGIENKVEYYIK